jgi:hypothetical protein
VQSFWESSPVAPAVGLPQDDQLRGERVVLDGRCCGDLVGTRPALACPGAVADLGNARQHADFKIYAPEPLQSQRGCVGHQQARYPEALEAGRKAGAARATDARLMAMVLDSTAHILVGAVSPRLMWTGAMKAGLTTEELMTLIHDDALAASELQWL